MTFDTLTAVYIGNGLGIGLLFTLFFSNVGKIVSDKEVRSVFRLMLIAGVACSMDPIVYLVDGRPGLFYTIVIYVGNTILYLSNMLIGRVWLKFLSNHIGMTVSRAEDVLSRILFWLGVAALAVNPFYPIVFSVRNNVYHREMFFWIFVAIGGIFMVMSLEVYVRARKQGGVFTFFPVQVFIVPVIIGVILQSAFYGVSLVWACMCVGIAGCMTALKNETIYKDGLTGIYNRAYLEYILDELTRKKVGFITGMMLDLNGFKGINDNFGHGAGDDALIDTAELMKKTVGGYGSVIRYAGDEFVILINTVEDKKVKKCIKMLYDAFESYNSTSGKPYKLSFSVGYATMDVKNQTMNDFMNTIDKKMYENKSEYYEATGLERRK